MKIINKIINFLFFKENKNKDSLYKQLNKEYTLDNINTLSKTYPVIIFKHSERCSVSLNALKGYINLFKEKKDDYIFLIVEVRKNKLFSQKLSDFYCVKHESPQILIIKSKKCVFNKSHENIDFEYIKNNF
jgi:bacillithiol system protein YtxJ